MKDSKYKGKKCFVIMPFGTKQDIDFNHICHELIKKGGRCDEFMDTAPSKKMFRGIFDSGKEPIK